jgi:Cytochrome b5-like Heme/Steroid binding domain
LYIMPLFVMLVLSAVTVFRREMSCNHNYRHALEADPQTAVSLFAAFSWLGFHRGEHHEEWDTTTKDGRKERPWPPARRALDGIMAKLPRQVFERLSHAILPRQRKAATTTSPLHPGGFPADVQVNIMSFLQPREVVAFACTNRVGRAIVDGEGPTPTAVWKTLWQRDYGWIIHSWEIGRQAFLRSNHPDEPHGKEFYFRFGLSYVNYLLAGWNTPERCLVGLQGSLYDITDFVLRHPGSPETLFVHAGRDATKLFDDMDHSKGARRIAKEFCIAVDMSSVGSCGLKPTREFEADRPIPHMVEAQPVTGKKERRRRIPDCLQKVYDDFHAERHQQMKQLRQEMKLDKTVLHWTLYYDPFQQAWKTWYTSRDFETVFK